MNQKESSMIRPKEERKAVQKQTKIPEYLFPIREWTDYEFIRNQITEVYLTDINDPCLDEALKKLEETSDGKRIAFDLEYMNNDHQLALIQFGTVQRAVTIRYVQEHNGLQHDFLKEFINAHDFIGKGIGGDMKSLQKKFGIDFSNKFIDFETSYMTKYDENLSFDTMVEKYIGEITDDFPNMKHQNWLIEALTTKHVLYATFDAVGLHKAYLTASERYPGEEFKVSKVMHKNNQ